MQRRRRGPSGVTDFRVICPRQFCWRLLHPYAVTRSATAVTVFITWKMEGTVFERSPLYLSGWQSCQSWQYVVLAVGIECYLGGYHFSTAVTMSLVLHLVPQSPVPLWPPMKIDRQPLVHIRQRNQPPGVLHEGNGAVTRTVLSI